MQRMFVLLVLSWLPGCIVYAPIGAGLPPSGLTEVVVREADSFWTGEKILVLGIDGVLTDESTASWLGGTRNSVADLVAQLDVALRDGDISAVVLRIDSPGGGVTAADLMHRELLAWKERRGIPVIACMMDVAASGGVYVAMAADRVFALPTTLTGSIGVLTQVTNAEGLMDLVGLESDTIKSGALKDMGSPFRALTEGERAIFQDLVDSYHERFVEIVAAGRPNLDVADVRKFADGRVLTARQALDAGLVDAVGYLDEAIDAAMSAAGLDDAEVITYRVGTGTPRNIYAGSYIPANGLLGLLPRSTVRFGYEWTGP